MKEIVVDFRREHTLHAPLTIICAAVEAEQHQEPVIQLLQPAAVRVETVDPLSQNQLHPQYVL